MECDTCAKHPSKPVTSYCTHHRISMCITCLLKDHKDCINQVEAIETAHNNFATASVELERISDRLGATIAKVKERKSAWVENVEDVNNQLLKGIAQKSSRIVHKVKQLATDASDMIKSVLDDHRKMYEADIDFLCRLERRQKVVKRKLNKRNNISELLPLENDLESIEREFKSRRLKSGDVKIHFYVSDIMCQLENEEQTFGNLCVEDISEEIPSPYMRMSNLNRTNADTLDDKRRKDMSRDSNGIFITADKPDAENNVYTFPDSSTSSPLMERHDRAPPLPTMENRLLSPKITNDIDFDVLVRKLSIGSRVGGEEIPDEVSDALDLVSGMHRPTQSKVVNHGAKTSHLNSSKCQQSLLAEQATNTSVLHANPADSIENTPGFETSPNLRSANVQSSYPEKQFNETNRATLPRFQRKPKPPRTMRSWPTACDTQPPESTHVTSDINYIESQTADNSDLNAALSGTQTQKQLPESHGNNKLDRQYEGDGNIKETPKSHERNSSDYRPSVRSRRDSGIGLSAEIPITEKTVSDASPLKIPPLPIYNKRRKQSHPNISTSKKESTAQLRRHETTRCYSNRKSRSESDLSQKNKDVTYIRAKEMAPEKEVLFKNNMLGIETEDRNRRTKSADSSKIKNKHGNIILDIPVDNMCAEQDVASAAFPSMIELSSDKTKSRNESFITGITALDGGNLVVCDFRNNSIELFDSYGLLKASYEIQKPFGCAHIKDKRFAVTSRDKNCITLFSAEKSQLKTIGDVVINKSTDVFGISFTRGFFCVSCLSEVILVNEQLPETQIVIKPVERREKWRTSWFSKGNAQKTFFTDVQYAVMEQFGDRRYIFTSDVRRRRVSSVGLNNMVIWSQSDLDCRSLVQHAHQIIVATETRVVFFQALSGDHIRDVTIGIPRNAWGLAIEKEMFRWLLISGSGKSCSRQVMRVGLTSISDRATIRGLPDVQFI